MKVTYIDTKTGETTTESGLHPFQVAENNWSCDCNRQYAFKHDSYEEEMKAWEDGGFEGEEPSNSRCLGSHRYIVVAFEFEPKDDDGRDLSGYTLDEFNESYPDETRNLGYKMWEDIRKKARTAMKQEPIML